MNKKDYSLDYLGKLFVEKGRKQHGLDGAYPFAFGSIIGMLDITMKYHPDKYQETINENVERLEKELAA